MEEYVYDNSTNMTREEFNNLYNKVSDVLYGFKSYHCWYCCRNETYYDNSMDFEVHVHSDKGDGDDWVEYWSIDDEGKIYSENTTYNTFEEFFKLEDIKGDYEFSYPAITAVGKTLHITYTNERKTIIY